MSATKEQKAQVEETLAATTEAPTTEVMVKAPEPWIILKSQPKSKEDMYRQFASALNDKVQAVFEPLAKHYQEKYKDSRKMRQVFGDQHARDIVVAVFEGLLDICLSPNENGQVAPASVGIPGGFGSLQLTTAAATTKRTPQGQTVNVPCRWRSKWSPGKAVDERLDVLPPPLAEVQEVPASE